MVSFTFFSSISCSDFLKLISSKFDIPVSEIFLCRHGISLGFLSESLLGSNLHNAVLDLHVRLRGGSDDEDSTKGACSSLPAASQNISVYHPSIPQLFLGADKSATAWLIVVDSTLENLRLTTSKAKFDFVLPQLSAEMLARLARKIPSLVKDADPYKALKTAIEELYCEPKSEIFGQYFKTQVLGGEKPSVFLQKAIDHLKALRPSMTMDDEILRRCFLSALPQQTQAILAVSESTSLLDLAAMADKITDISSSFSSPPLNIPVNAAQCSPSQNDLLSSN